MKDNSKIPVKVSLPHGTFDCYLIQFIVVPDAKGESEVLAVCMDEKGYFDTYALGSVKAVV